MFPDAVKSTSALVLGQLACYIVYLNEQFSRLGFPLFLLVSLRSFTVQCSTQHRIVVMCFSACEVERNLFHFTTFEFPRYCARYC